LVIGCASAGSHPVTPSTPIPVTPPIPVEIAKSWRFFRSPGVVSYQITRTGTLETGTVRQEIPTSSAYEVISADILGDSLKISARVDTFSIAGQQTATAAQPRFPIDISALVIHDSVKIVGDSAPQNCDPALAALITDLHNLFVHFPDTLSVGMTWRDSADVANCQAAVPTQAHIVRGYAVSSEATFEGTPAIVVLRTDTIHAGGEGVQQQHQIKLDAIGTGTATYYLDVARGQILHLSVNQNLSITVSAAAASTHFQQISTQDFKLTR
jgi:hypothetical protein